MGSQALSPVWRTMQKSEKTMAAKQNKSGKTRAPRGKPVPTRKAKGTKDKADIAPQSVYTRDIENEIFDRLAAGEMLSNICLDEHLPSSFTVRRWLRDDLNGMANRYDIAREAQGDQLAEQVITIADDKSEDYIEITVNGQKRIIVDKENIQRSRIRADNRKWLASRINPKKYGDRVTNEHTGEGGGPMRHEVRSLSDFYGSKIDKND